MGTTTKQNMFSKVRILKVMMLWGANVRGQKIVFDANSKIWKYGFLRELLIHFEEVQYHRPKNNEVLSCRKEKTKRPQFMIMLARK